MPLDDPAVTVPSAAKAGFILLQLLERRIGTRVLVAIDDRVSPFAPGTVTGTISSSNFFAATAAAVRRWLSAANAS